MRKKNIILTAYLLLILLISNCATGSGVRSYSDVNPESLGFSSKQLDSITAEIKEDVEWKKIPGAVVLISRKGKIAYCVSVGMQDGKSGKEMSRDSIFRIASMSKPIISVSVMILVEEGKLSIKDPVSKYLPEFRNMKVGIEIKDKKTGKVTGLKTVQAKRQITIRDLLRHTSGLTYGFFGKSAIKTMYKRSGIISPYQTLEDFTKKLSKLPLCFEPGTKWDYGRSTDVLGRLIEVVSGKTLDRFLEERIFRPLGMKDTGFYVKKENLGRLAGPINMSPWYINVSSRPKLFSGGNGLVSTVDDYHRFLQMLLNRGELNGKRILKSNTVKLMTSDHLGPLSNRKDYGIGNYMPGPGYGFGLGFAVRKKNKAIFPGSIGDYWWPGIYCTTFWVDPKEEIIAIFMTQNLMRLRYYIRQSRKWVYSAKIDHK